VTYWHAVYTASANIDNDFENDFMVATDPTARGNTPSAAIATATAAAATTSSNFKIDIHNCNNDAVIVHDDNDNGSEITAAATTVAAAAAADRHTHFRSERLFTSPVPGLEYELNRPRQTDGFDEELTAHDDDDDYVD